MMANKINEIAESKNATITVGTSKSTEADSDQEEKKSNKKWKEVKAEDGQSYYWNMETQGSIFPNI